jgi:hypothetical protein
LKILLIWANLQRIIELSTQRIANKLSKIWVLGSGIWKVLNTSDLFSKRTGAFLIKTTSGFSPRTIQRFYALTGATGQHVEKEYI